MGRVIIPFNFFEKRLTIYDEEERPIYEIISYQNKMFTQQKLKLKLNIIKNSTSN